MKYFASLAATMVATASISNAAILADFQFPGSSLASADPSTNWTTTNISDGPGVPMTINVGNPSPGIDIKFGDFDNGNLTNALAAGDYYSFTVTPDAGQQIDF